VRKHDRIGLSKGFCKESGFDQSTRGKQVKEVKMGRRRKLIFAATIVTLLTSAVLFSGCYKDYGLTISDFDTVITAHDQEIDFKAYTTYYLDPTFKDLNDLDNPSPDQPDNAATFISAIDTEMAAYGWTSVGSGSEDVTIELGYTTTDYFYYYCYPYYGWYYYPYCGYTYSYSGGTAIIQIVDPNDVDTEGNPRALWQAGLNGALNDSTQSLQQRIEDGIAQAFAQSPYLNIN
jgi:hypothetical protein